MDSPSERSNLQVRLRGNTLLEKLSSADTELLAPYMVTVELTAKERLSQAGEAPAYVYFPCGGIVSYTMSLPHSGLVEFGIVGREGMSSFSALRAGQRAPVSTMVQIGGCQAYRIRSEHLREAAASSATIQAHLYDFLYDFMSQMAVTAVSNARHSVNARLARWLLMCHDRVDGDEIHLTHSFIGMMLGAQRTTVTSSLHVLEGEGAIRSLRGVVIIIDRQRLETCAGEAYSRDRYKRMVI